MTTDITELAQREKFEAWWERTQHNGNPPRFGWSHWRDGEGYKVDDDDSELEGMWSAWKAAGAEMRERMLAAEARVVELESRTTNDRIVAESEARGVEKFAKYIALYNSDAEWHAVNFAKQLRVEAEHGN